MKNLQIKRLIVITRDDLKPGQQLAQSGHSVAQYMLDYPEMAKEWNNSFLISLSVKSEEKLKFLLKKLLDMGISVSYFVEPDIGYQLTSICFIETEQTKELTIRLPLSLKH